MASKPKTTRPRGEHKSLSDPDPQLLSLLGSSGGSMTPRRALGCTAVAAAVRAIAEPMGQLPIHVYRRGDDGARARDTSHPASRLLHDDANPWTSAGELRTQLTVDALLHGNGFAFINRVDGRPVEMLRLPPDAVTATADERTREPRYVLREKAGQRRIDRRDVLHIRTSIALDGLNGEAPIKLARQAIDVALLLEKTERSVFRNAIRPSGTLKAPEGWNLKKVNEIREVLEGQHAGEDNAGSVLILPGLEYKPFEFSSTDSQFAELRKFAIEEIARAFRVPPHLLYEMGRATWGTPRRWARRS